MKRILIAAILLVFIGCKEKKENPYTYSWEVGKTTVDSINVVNTPKIDTISSYLSEKQRLLLKLIGLRLRANDAKFERDEMEIRYLRTGNDKYRRIGNKKEDLRVLLNKEMIAVSDTLDSLH